MYVHNKHGELSDLDNDQEKKGYRLCLSAKTILNVSVDVSFELLETRFLQSCLYKSPS